jgi:hypothetical protein
VKADTRYICKIISAELAESTKKGTDALDVEVEITDGDCAGERTVASLWLTDNTRDQVKRTLKDIGLSSEEIASEKFWLAPTGLLADRVCSIVTMLDDFGEVRVRYLNGPSRGRNRPSKDGAAAAKRAAGLFSSNHQQKEVFSALSPPIEDDDVPF